MRSTSLYSVADFQFRFHLTKFMVIPKICLLYAFEVTVSELLTSHSDFLREVHPPIPSTDFQNRALPTPRKLKLHKNCMDRFKLKLHL